MAKQGQLLFTLNYGPNAGKQGEAPGNFGIPGEDIFCRCRMRVVPVKRNGQPFSPTMVTNPASGEPVQFMDFVERYNQERALKKGEGLSEVIKPIAELPAQKLLSFEDQGWELKGYTDRAHHFEMSEEETEQYMFQDDDIDEETMPDLYEAFLIKKNQANNPNYTVKDFYRDTLNHPYMAFKDYKMMDPEKKARLRKQSHQVVSKGQNRLLKDLYGEEYDLDKLGTLGGGNIMNNEEGARELVITRKTWTSHSGQQMTKLNINGRHWNGFEMNRDIYLGQEADEKGNYSGKQKGIKLENNLWKIDKSKQGKGGYSTQQFEYNVQLCQQLGIPRMECFAAGEGDPSTGGSTGTYNGYNTWLRFGYDANASEIYQVPGIMHRFYPGQKIETLHQLLDLPDGKKVWRENGGSWAAHFTIRKEDNVQAFDSMAHWEAYKKEKGLQYPKYYTGKSPEQIAAEKAAAEAKAAAIAKAKMMAKAQYLQSMKIKANEAIKQEKAYQAWLKQQEAKKEEEAKAKAAAEAKAKKAAEAKDKKKGKKKVETIPLNKAEELLLKESQNKNGKGFVSIRSTEGNLQSKLEQMVATGEITEEERLSIGRVYGALYNFQASHSGCQKVRQFVADVIKDGKAGRKLDIDSEIVDTGWTSRFDTTYTNMTRREARAIQNLINSSPIVEQRLYRGTQYRGGALRKGDTVPFIGPTSFSDDEQIANSFLDKTSTSARPGRKTKFIVEPNTTRGLQYNAAMGPFDNEKETLLSGQYVVVQVKTIGANTDYEYDIVTIRQKAMWEV